jgi:predicted RNase H-like nuclease (RuvC/YqgF family)
MEIDDELGMKLHDKATRGLPLSTEEQAQLQSWYDKWDRIEMEQLRLTPEQMAEEESRLAELRAQVEAEEMQVAELIKSNWELARQNEALHAEIESLRQQLTERIVSKPSQPPQSAQPIG